MPLAVKASVAPEASSAAGTNEPASATPPPGLTATMEPGGKVARYAGSSRMPERCAGSPHALLKAVSFAGSATGSTQTRCCVRHECVSRPLRGVCSSSGRLATPQ